MKITDPNTRKGGRGSKVKRTTLLTPKEEFFCMEYIKDRNATQAAIRAQFSQNYKSASVIASKLLRRPNVRYQINRMIEAQCNRIKVDTDFVLKELIKLATFDIQDIYDEDGNIKPVQDLPETVRKAIATIEVEELYAGRGLARKNVGRNVKIKFWDKSKALENLGRYLKMFGDVNIDNSKHYHLTVEKKEEILANTREAVKAGLF